MSKWSNFRSQIEDVPTRPFEASVFLNNARCYLNSFGDATVEARMVLNDAAGRVNDDWLAEVREWIVGEETQKMTIDIVAKTIGYFVMIRAGTIK